VPTFPPRSILIDPIYVVQTSASLCMSVNDVLILTALLTRNSMRIRNALTSVAVAAAAILGAVPAQAAPIPCIDHTLQIDTRLRLVGINPVDTPGYATKVCRTLHEDPTADGKRAALD